VLHYEDHIRRPLPGGNQSLLMKLKGENTTLSLTIQTELMRKAARFGVVLGENAPQACRSAIQASMQNLNTLIDDACAKTTFNDLLDYLHQEKSGSIPHMDIYMNCLKAQRWWILPMLPVSFGQPCGRC
jgi:guanosine-3',5'-bis(diphosphate) 3'-pyrophosphohydrolase